MKLPIRLGLVGLLSLPACLNAQPASQHGTLSQMVNETLITLEYDRPVARGRELFGELVEYDVIWTPGANRATWVEFSAPVWVEDQPLPAGKYGIWTIPGAESWEVIFVSEWDTHHSYFSFESEVLRVNVPPVERSHMEVLAFYFPEVGPREATLTMHWGPTAVPLKIRVGDQ